MLHILLLILKIIGIVLAVIIGVILFMIVCVLLIPVRYRIKCDGKLGGKEPFRAEIKISWLFHIVNAVFSYPNAAYLKVKLFCFTILDSSKTSGARTKNGEAEAKEAHRKKKRNRHTQTEPLEETDNKISNKYGNKENKEDTNKDSDVESNAESNKEIKNNTESKHEKTQDNTDSKSPDKEQPVIRFLRMLWGAFKNIKYTIDVICDKIKKIIENIQYYTELLQSDLFQAAFHVSKKQLKRIFGTLRPGTCRINLIAGTGDPAGTGQILAFYGMLYPYIGNNVSVQADFEERVIEGDLYIKGKITIIFLLISAFRLYTDKNIRKLINIVQREDA